MTPPKAVVAHMTSDGIWTYSFIYQDETTSQEFNEAQTILVLERAGIADPQAELYAARRIALNNRQ